MLNTPPNIADSRPTLGFLEIRSGNGLEVRGIRRSFFHHMSTDKSVRLGTLGEYYE